MQQPTTRLLAVLSVTASLASFPAVAGQRMDDSQVSPQMRG